MALRPRDSQPGFAYDELLAVAQGGAAVEAFAVDEGAVSGAGIFEDHPSGGRLQDGPAERPPHDGGGH